VGAGVLVLIVLGVMGHQISQNEKRIGEAFQGMKEARDQIGLLQGAVTENSDAIAAARAGLTTLTGQFEELSTRLDRQKILKWKSQLNQQAAVLEELGKLQNPEVQTRFGQVSDGLKVLSSTL
jgi:chromosome segregation ATPase